MLEFLRGDDDEKPQFRELLFRRGELDSLLGSDSMTRDKRLCRNNETPAATTR
jgi:hypothetical protein